MTTLHAWPDVDGAELQRARTERVGSVCAELGIDHLVLQEPDNIRYATDHRAHLTCESGWHAAVVAADGEAHLFVEYVDEAISDPDPDRPAVRSLNPHPGWGPASANPATWLRLVGGRVRQVGARRVGVDGIDAHLLDGLREACPGVAFVPAGMALLRVRRTKHPLEVQLVEAACRANSLAMDAAMDAVRPGVTDHEILGTAARAQHLLGVEFVTHSVCNVRGGSGDWFARNAALRDGDAYFFDIGCYGVGGYGSDAARTAFVGEPHPRVLTAFGHLLEAHALAQELCVPGARASTIHDAVNAHLVGHGLRRTPYAVGHGVGLRMCELPTVARIDLMDVDDVIREGMCLAIEPETTVVVDGRPVVLKVEDDFVVEATGVRALTTPYDVEASVR